LKDNSLILKAKGTSPEDSNPMAINAGDLAYEVTVDVEVEGKAQAGLLLCYNPTALAWESATKLCGKVPWAN
jgi:hypothetical protein